MTPIRLIAPAQRDYAKRQIDAAPDGYIVTLREPTRTNDQNAKLHAMLTDIARQKPMGWTRDIDTWKAIMLRALKHEIRFTEGLDGEMFPIGLKTSSLTVRQMSDLIEFTYAFGAEQGIVWSEPCPYGDAA